MENLLIIRISSHRFQFSVGKGKAVRRALLSVHAKIDIPRKEI